MMAEVLIGRRGRRNPIRSGLITRDIENPYLAFDPGEEAPINALLDASITCRIAAGPREGQMFTQVRGHRASGFIADLTRFTGRLPVEADFDARLLTWSAEIYSTLVRLRL